MPRSKHRHKGGGKAVKKPGRGAARRELPESPDMIAWRQLKELYFAPFHQQWPDEGPHHSGFMLECIGIEAFEAWPLITNPVSKQAIFAAFTKPIEDIDTLTTETFTLDTAEAALAFLVEHGFALVDGDQISIPEQFIPKED